MADRDDITEERGLSPTLIAGVVLALAAIDFIVQNRRQLEIHFLFFSFTARVWTALLITAVLSILAAELVGRSLRRRRNH